MNNIKIYVACHKPYDVYKNNVYTPIHVGRSISKFKEEMADMIGDDTGDNISDRNPQYCEMTAQYWAWKNVKDTEYIGFCHYRRGFEYRFSQDNICNYLTTSSDVIMAGPMLRDHGRLNYLKTFVCGEDIAIMLYVVQKLYPDYYQTLSDYANGIVDYPLNMFVCKKDLFDKYAKWVFDILFECEKLIKPSPYSRARRVLGYLSEFLMPVFFMHNHCNIKPVRYTIENGEFRGGIGKASLYKMKLIDWIYWRGRKKPLIGIDYSLKVGLANDNIINIEDYKI